MLEKTKEVMKQHEEMSLKDRLEKLPGEILLKEEETFLKANRVKELDVKMKVIKNSLQQDILGLEDPETHKAIFSNDTSRKAELVKQLGCNSGYLQAQVDYDNLSQLIVLDGFYLDYMKRVLRAADSIIRLGDR